MKILIVEDQKELSDTIAEYLKSESYHCERAFSFYQASEKIHLYEYDVVVLDLNLPDGDGLEILAALKQVKPDTGIIILSARDTLADKLTGLNLGADDYLTKPFELAELNARIKSVIRRRNFMGENIIHFNEISINPESKEVKVNDRPVKLTRKEFELLLYFISNKNKVLTKNAIAEHLWGDEIDLWDNLDFIYVHIRNLRKKIMGLGGTDYIKTVYGLGYKFGSL